MRRRTRQADTPKGANLRKHAGAFRLGHLQLASSQCPDQHALNHPWPAPMGPRPWASQGIADRKLSSSPKCPAVRRTRPPPRQCAPTLGAFAAPSLSAKRCFACREGVCDANARGGGERDRTDDLLLAKQALSQLSYTPVPEDRDRGSVVSTEVRYHRSGWKPPTVVVRAEPERPAPSVLISDPWLLIPELVGQGGFEPPTSRLSSARSNQLSY